jgi:hypothetical protein
VEWTKNAIHEGYENSTPQVPMMEVMIDTMVTDVGKYGHTLKYDARCLCGGSEKLSDTGVNCCMTNNLKLLKNIMILS